jgi:selenocysteine lyase/cysteine desulfurase
MDELEKIGGTLITHRDPKHRSGIVIARLYDDVKTDRQILSELHQQKIFIAQRFTDFIGGFRISCHYFNNESDIDRMIAAMSGIINSIGKKPDYKKQGGDQC